MDSQIHLFKKSAIEAGTPSKYYLNPSEKMMKMSSEWSAADEGDMITVTVRHDGFGDRVFFFGKEGSLHVEVAKENKEKSARFGIKDGMKNLSIELNPRTLDLQHFFKIEEGITVALIRKLKLKPGEKNPNFMFH